MASRSRRFRHVAGGLLLAACLAGCVSMPSGGAVQSYQVTQGSGAQSQRYLQLIPEPPGAGWSPSEIVRGFLAASASFADRQRTAREYLTASFSRDWNPTWSATVFSDAGPNVGSAAISGGGKRKQPMAATVTVSGIVQASLSGSGTYAVPSSSASTAQGQSYTFSLVKVDGQWRISSAPPNVLLLTSVEFNVDYQLRNLYFFDPSGRYLVPDPVYVPLQTTPSDLMNGLVRDLITQPKDWLAHGATRTAFPVGTKLMSAVMLDGGTAAVNLGGTILRTSDQVREQVSAQLLSTLSGSNQGQALVQSVELFQDGKPWSPPGQQDNPVQHDSGYSVPTGTSGQFYYLDNSGVLWRRDGADGTAVKGASIGTGYSAIAVSRDGRYLAALRNGIVYAGPVGGPLVPRTGTGTGYTTMSWDPNDNLWAAGSDGIVMLRANASPRSAAGAPVQVQVYGAEGILVPPPFAGLSVAPDGVRVAVIIGPSELGFGAVVDQPPTHVGQQPVIRIQLSPAFYVSGPNDFQSVAWYGPDNVITLTESEPEPTLTEYPVNGGTATRISSQDGIVSIAVSYGSALIAEARKGVLLSDASTSGSWASIGFGLTPAYPG